MNEAFKAVPRVPHSFLPFCRHISQNRSIDAGTPGFIFSFPKAPFKSLDFGTYTPFCQIARLNSARAGLSPRALALNSRAIDHKHNDGNLGASRSLTPQSNTKWGSLFFERYREIMFEHELGTRLPTGRRQCSRQRTPHRQGPRQWRLRRRVPSSCSNIISPIPFEIDSIRNPLSQSPPQPCAQCQTAVRLYSVPSRVPQHARPGPPRLDFWI